MVDILMIGLLAVGAVGFAALAIVREVRYRRAMDKNARKLLGLDQSGAENA